MTESILAVVVEGKAELGKLMQMSGCFERFKAFAEPKMVEFTLKENHPPLDEVVQTLAQKYKEAAETLGVRVVAFIALKPRFEVAYRDESIKAISNGTKWMVLDQVIAHYRTAFESNEVESHG